MPTAHLATIDDLDEATAGKLAWATVRVSRAVRSAYAPDRINVWQSNGEAAGQEVPLERYNANSEVLARVAERVGRSLV
jgi:histidine triad (HIT) family protein